MKSYVSCFLVTNIQFWNEVFIQLSVETRQYVLVDETKPFL